jgi:hypothetical protein
MSQCYAGENVFCAQATHGEVIPILYRSLVAHSEELGRIVERRWSKNLACGNPLQFKLAGYSSNTAITIEQEFPSNPTPFISALRALIV